LIPEKYKSRFFWAGGVYFFLSLLSINIRAQLVTQGGFSAQHLVQNVLLGGGVDAFNFSIQGAPVAYGTFNGTNTNIGLNEGVILTTGAISGPEGPHGPNNKPNAGIDNGAPGSNLINLAFGYPQPSFNATTLSFDFIPQGDSVAFRYVFGSEEYKEFVGSEFNDAFGFFISGPNPAGGFYNNRNLALIPGSATPVAINNVNHLTNSQFYIDNEMPPGLTIQYDGFTRPMLAWAKVIPCQTYTIRMVVADIADPIYDSGVFLEARSFKSRGYEMRYEIVDSPSSDTLFSNCGRLRIVIRSTGDNSQARTLNLNLSGNSINGVDYQTLPTTVTLPAGQDSIVIFTEALFNAAGPNVKNLIVQLDDPDLCPNITLPFINVPLVRINPMDVQTMNDLSFECNNRLVDLSVSVSGGLPPFQVSWTPGGHIGTPATVFVTRPTTFTANITDRCGNTASDQVLITMPDAQLRVRSTPDTAVCPGEPVQLSATITGGIGSVVYSWSNGISNALQQTVFPAESQVYAITATDSCGNLASAATVVMVNAPIADFTYRYIRHSTIRFQPDFIAGVVSWQWDFGDGNFSDEEVPTHTYADTGFYDVRLIVFNQYGCSDTVLYPVYAFPPYVFYIPNTFTPNEDGINDIFRGKGEGFVGYKMWIFNRWGQELFHSNEYGRGWPGLRSDGSRLPLGVYVYKFELETPVGTIHEYRGHITLMR
jgi:gliding motility-associated-like protein